MFAAFFDRLIAFRARCRIQFDALQDLEDKRLRQQHEYEWEIRKRDNEIAALNSTVVFLSETVEFHRSVIARMTAQNSVDQALAQVGRSDVR